MSEISYTNWHLLSDEALEKEIGTYIKKTRQQQNRTQQELAKLANISRSTLSLLERGQSGSLKTLIQVLRVLNKLQLLAAFNYKEVISPLTLAKAEHKSKERVRKTKNTRATSFDKKSFW